MLDALKNLFKKLLFLKDYFFMSPILLAFTQFLGYKSKISYMNYFNIPSDLYKLNLISDLVPLFLNFIIYLIVILIFFIVISIFNILFNKLIDNVFGDIENIEGDLISKIKCFIKICQTILSRIYINYKKNYKLSDLFIAIISIYFVTISLFYSSCLLFNISYKGIIISSVVVLLLAAIISLLYTFFSAIILKRKKASKTSYIFIDYVFACILLCIYINVFSSIASFLGYISANNKVEFGVVNNEYVMLYNYNNYAVVAPFEYKEDSNSIIIDVSDLKNISLDNCEVSFIVINSFLKKGEINK